MEESRTSIMTHMSPDQLQKMESFKDLHKKAFYQNLKEFGEQKDIYGQTQSGCGKPVVGG